MLFGVFTVLTRPFHMVEGLDVAMRGAGEGGERRRGGGGGGRGSWGKGRDSLCCNMLLWWRNVL